MLGTALIIILFGMAITGFMVYAQMRKQRAELPGLTRHYFAVSAEPRDMPQITELASALDTRGYQITFEKSQSADNAGDEALDLAGEVILRDRRRPTGCVRLRFEKHSEAGDSETMDGEIVSEDDGPGFYEEMARYAIVALAELIPDLRHAEPGKDAGPARNLARELPAEPLGLSLL